MPTGKTIKCVSDSWVLGISLTHRNWEVGKAWTGHSALVQDIHWPETQMCAWGKVNPALWSQGPSADHHTLIKQAQASATPLITLHLEELLHIYHHFKGAPRDLMIRCIPCVFRHSVFLEEVLGVLHKHKSIVLSASPLEKKGYLLLNRVTSEEMWPDCF